LENTTAASWKCHAPMREKWRWWKEHIFHTQNGVGENIYIYIYIYELTSNTAMHARFMYIYELTSNTAMHARLEV
jgi:hypothetical protein